MSAGRVARLGVAAALYVALTVALGPLSYGAVQVRFAAGLMALAALDPWMIAAVALGTAVANLFGGLGPQDVVLGAAVTAATCGACWLLRRNRVATLAAIPLVSAPLLALYLHALFRLPFAVTAAWLAVGQSVAAATVGAACLRFGSVLSATGRLPSEEERRAAQ